MLFSGDFDFAGYRKTEKDGRGTAPSFRYPEKGMQRGKRMSLFDVVRSAYQAKAIEGPEGEEKGYFNLSKANSGYLPFALDVGGSLSWEDGADEGRSVPRFASLPMALLRRAGR